MHEMELQLELTLSRKSSSWNLLKRNMQLIHEISKKRSLGNAFEFDDDEDEVNSIDVVPQTLPLFVWKAKGEDDEHYLSFLHLNKVNEEEKNGVMGWPPIMILRKQIRYHHTNGGGGGGGGIGSGGDGRFNRDSMYVKVNMEGFGIGRKVDLSLHHSFGTLTNTLKLMFEKYYEKGTSYRLTYKDKEGDWLLAGDGPRKFHPNSATTENDQRMENKSVMAESQ